MNMQFPHSVLYSLQQVERYFKRLESISVPENFKEMEFLIGRSISNLKYGLNPQAGAEEIKALIIKTRAEIKAVAHKLATLYFGYS
jgi:uncharacterized alpha-E superfamily protein